MTRARGHVLQRAFAAYLTRWWPSAESTPSGRPGRDILGTPGVWFEVKSSFKGTSPGAVVADTNSACWYGAHNDLQVVVYYPTGTVAKGTGAAIVMLHVPELMRLLVDAGYAPQPKEDQ